MPVDPQTKEAVKVFYSYSHKDEKLRDTLEEHLSLLKRQGVISEWHDRRISAGDEWAGEIAAQMKAADILLLLVSSSFIASDYCYDVELKLALERHDDGSAVVVPVILRPCDWEKSLFGKLNALPKNGKPITKWTNKDDAFKDIANGIRRVAEELKTKRREAAAPEASTTADAQAPINLKVAAYSILRPPAVGFVARRDKEGRDIVGLLKDELAPDKNQLVALWGPGGVGKTTLAVEVVHATQEVFKGRIVWASSLQRADFTSATLLDEIATQLGREDLRRLAPEPKAAQVAALVSETPALVILDNFETVAEEEQTRCLDFLAQSAACPVLITTRGFINRDDVTNVELAAMELDEAREFLRRLIERTPKKQNFANLDQDDLIQKCEANPLLLQWVVRQIVLSKTPQTALDYLSHGEGDAAHCIFTRSFNLPQLGDDGRAALLSLSLFTPSASRDALAEVSGFDQDLRRLDESVKGLSSLWLVETTEGNERLFLRGLTRELAKSHLSRDVNADKFRRRYVSCFLRHAESHTRPTPEDLDALAVEKGNLLGAMDTAFAARDWESVMRIRTTLNNFLFLHGHWDEAVRSGGLAGAAAHEMKNDEYVALLNGNLALIRVNRGEYEEASKIYREAIEIFRKSGNEKSVAVCLHHLGIIAHEQGDLDEARKLYYESLEIKKRLGNLSSVAYTLGQLGTLAFDQGDANEARRLYNECLDISKKIGDQNSVAKALHQLGALAQHSGDHEEAWRLYEEGLDIARRLGNQSDIAEGLRNLGLLAEGEGNKTEAVRLFREALRVFEKLGSREAEKARRDLVRVIDNSD